MQIKARSDTKWWIPTWVPGSEQDPEMGWGPHSSIDSWYDCATQAVGLDNFSRQGMNGQSTQLRSRERVRELAEVFTSQREVNAILDLIPDSFNVIDTTFLEPTCGSGNFLVEILQRKLNHVTKSGSISQGHYEHRLLRATASIYGVDINFDNVIESRMRLMDVLRSHYQSETDAVQPTIEFLNAAEMIIKENVVLGDSLHGSRSIELCEWRPFSAGRFQRIWSYPLEPQDPDAKNFFAEERIQDLKPVHYSDLGAEFLASKTSKPSEHDQR